PQGSLKHNNCRHSRVGGNLVLRLEKILKTIYYDNLAKIPACAGMTLLWGWAFDKDFRLRRCSTPKAA
ncbi:MAG: hypothetical protein ACFNNL_09190, partial [Kingella oralis]